MKRGHILTLVLATAQRLVRMDFDRSVSYPNARFWNAARPPGSTVPEAVRGALALGGRAGQHVVVLADDFWAHSVSLNTTQTAGLCAKDIAQALAYEIEPFSNVAPGSAAVGFRTAQRSGDTDLYWVVETTHDELATIRDIVKTAGGRLIGVTHPGGLPEPLCAPPQGTSWRRVEYWAHSTVLVSTGKMGDVSVRSVAADSTELGKSSASEHAETLSLQSGIPSGDSPMIRDWQRFMLSDEGTLRHWMDAWARSLTAMAIRLALVRPLPVPTPVHRHVATGSLIALAVATLCLLHGWRARSHRDAMRGRLAAINESVAEIGRVEGDNTRLRQNLDVLHQQSRKAEMSSRLLACQRRALPTLLRGLSSARPPNVVIQEIRDDGSHALLVSGLSMSAGVADEMATRLAAALQTSGWSVEPMRKDARRLLEGAGPWRFVLRVSLANPPEAPAVAPANGPAAAEGGVP